jgi:DNA-binding LacI/PurR family transcriptional regulator
MPAWFMHQGTAHVVKVPLDPASSFQYSGCRDLGNTTADDALFAVGDIMAFGALPAIKAAGLRIPEDVAVIGHDDLEMARYVDPPLTTFRLRLVDMASGAAAMVMEMLNRRHTSAMHRVYDAELIVRRSTSKLDRYAEAQPTR